MRVDGSTHLNIFHRPALVAIGLEFIEEANWGLTPDPGRIYDYIGEIGGDPRFCVYTALVDDIIVGWVVGSASCIFSKEPIGTLEFLYVKKEHRSLRLASMLLTAMRDDLVSKGCTRIYANSVSEISPRNSKAFSAIIRRLGYTHVGDSYVWNIQ